MRIIIIVTMMVMLGAFPARSNAWSAEADCVARTVYLEARGSSFVGMLAVAQVVINRSRDDYWPSSLCAVVMQRHGGQCQFTTCRVRLRPHAGDPDWLRAWDATTAALLGAPDVTGGAHFFHATHVNPRWSYRRTGTVGHHVFYARRPNG